MAEMAVFNLPGNLKWGRRTWSVIYSFPTDTNYKYILEYMSCSVEKTLPVAWLDDKLLLQ